MKNMTCKAAIEAWVMNSPENAKLRKEYRRRGRSQAHMHQPTNRQNR
jgi:hypothetical protein